MARRRAAVQGLALLLIGLCALCAASCCAASASTLVLELGEDTFDSSVQTDVWLVDVYATWCSHCRQLEPVWQAVAQELKADPAYKVAKIDGPRNRGLLNRLQVEAFPSIFLLRDGRMWQYSGSRTTDAIIQFARSGYKTEQPLPPHRCPNHLLGRLMAHVHMLPTKVKHAYKHLKEDHGWSDLTILVAMLAVPVVSGVATICFLDAVYLRKARQGDDDELDASAPQAQPAGGAAPGPQQAAAPQAAH